MAGKTLDFSAGVLDRYKRSNYSVVSGNGSYIQLGDAAKFVPNLFGDVSSENITDMYNSTAIFCNGSSVGNNSIDCNETAGGYPGTPYPLWQLIVLGTLAALTSIITIIGNSVVILSFVLDRQIRQPTNYFIASLAVSDLLIGTFSMPFYTVYLLYGQYWTLGDLICDLWLSLDYTVCLTSIYTVFCITIDRFCSVRIPAKYRNWRTDRKVLIMIACTWVIPITVFFTSIFGWQYFIGERKIDEGKCYVLYLAEGIFNCILQVGYFWITLVVMCTLYTGIYKVALNLQRKSEAKHKKMTSLVSMAGQTMTKIGIGMSQQQKHESKKVFPENGKSEVMVKQQSGGTRGHETTTTSLMANRTHEREEDRSSSPAFPSDTDPSSSQSPKRSPKPKKDTKKASKHKSHHSHHGSGLAVPKLAPPKNEKRIYKLEKHLPNAVTNGAHGISSLAQALQAPGIAFQYNSPSGAKETAGNGEASVNPSYSADQLTKLDDDGMTDTVETRDACVGVMYSNDDDDEIVVPKETIVTPTGIEVDDHHSLKSQSDDEIKEILRRGQHSIDDQEIADTKPSPVWKKRSPLFQDEDEDADEEGEADNEGLLSGTNCPDMDTAKWSTSPTPPKSPVASSSSSSFHESQVPLRPVKRHSRSLSLPKQDSIPADPLPSTQVDNIKMNQSGTTSANVVTFCPSTALEASTTAYLDSSSVGFTDDQIQTMSTNADEIIPSSRDKKVKKSALGMVPYIRSIRKNKKNRKPKIEKKQSKSENRARKALRTITIILGAFVICWTPWHVLSMISGFCPECVPNLPYDISYWLCYLNSPINPFCYAFANQQFKKAFIKIIKLDWRRT